MGEGLPSTQEGRGWGVSIFITCWQGVAPSPVRWWSRQAAWPQHRTLPAESQVFCGGFDQLGAGGGDRQDASWATPDPRTFRGCFCSREEV